MSNSDQMGRVKLIANSGSGNPLEANARIEQVTRCLLDLGVNVDVALVHPARKAVSIAKKAVKKGYSTIIAMGGDGTISAVVRGIVDSDVRLGVIAAGTENDIATSLGIPEDLKEACKLIASGQTRNLDLAQISTKEKKRFVFLMVATVGLATTLYPDIKDVPHGDIASLKDAFMTLIHAKPNPKVFLTLDDSKVEVETMMVAITNTPVIAAKNLIAPEASMDDGLLDIAVFPNFSKAELVAYFAKTAEQREASDGKVQRYRARKVKIKTEPKQDIAAEGILLGQGKAKIKVLPGALRVIAPPVGTGAEKPQAETAEDLPTPVSLSLGAGRES
jgi:YegS/Rv2252/BmrU family lipid kinase